LLQLPCGANLAIAAKIARAHGGKINVQSSPGQGSAFFGFPAVCFPRYLDPFAQEK
jgi:signal transduction histidine kinase